MPLFDPPLQLRLASRPIAVRRGIVERARRLRRRFPGSISRWRLAYLGVLAALVVPSQRHELLGDLATCAWVIAGAAAWLVGIGVDADVRRRRLAHDESGLRSIAGWRIVSGSAATNPDLLLAMDLFAYLVDHASITQVPIRGRRHRSRTTYAVSLRTLARGWARSTGISGRRADRILAAELCDRYRVVRRVPIGTTAAYRLADATIAGAIAHLEHAAGSSLVAWHLGRDPAWDVPTAV